MPFNMRTFMLSGKASKVIGEKLGWLYGNIIVEVVLAVVTVGIGTAIKGGLKAVEWLGKFANWFRKFGKIGKGIAKVADWLGKGLKWLIGTFQKFAEKLIELGNKLMEKFKAIFKNLEKKIDDIVAKLKGKVDDAPGGDKKPDVDGHHGQIKDHPDGKKLDSDGVVDTDGIDPEDAKKRKPKGDKESDLVWAVAEAKVKIKAFDAANIEAHIAALSVFRKLHAKYRWIHNVVAETSGVGVFDIYIIASKTRFYAKFTAFGDDQPNYDMDDQAQMDHLFDRHANEWYGRPVNRTTHMEQWRKCVERISKSRYKFFDSLRGKKTVAFLGKLDGKYMVVHYYFDGPLAGKVASAFRPDNKQLSNYFLKLGAR